VFVVVVVVVYFVIDSVWKLLDTPPYTNFHLADGGSPSRSNTTQLLVNVLDVNDNAPRFYTSLFQESVSENVPTGFSIVRVGVACLCNHQLLVRVVGT
jgi:hypothetical protein